MQPYDLTGKDALIAGSTQGIGFAAAHALASLGASCTLLARNPERLDDALARLPRNGAQRHRALVADFRQPDQVREAVSRHLQSAKADILVNNTGGPAAGPIVSATAEQFTEAFSQHLLCNHLLAGLVAEGMKQRREGRIVNVISTSVKIPLRNLGVSNTIRGAVASWAKTLSNELAPFGITVNNVLPGATATGRLDAIIGNKVEKTGASRETVEEEMVSEIPMGRFAAPEEIAAVIAFLASPAASYVTGVSIPVDGGRTGSL